MRQSTNKARRHEPGFELRGKAATPARVHRSDPLRLPVFDCGAELDHSTPQEAAFALHWLAAGFIDESMHALPTKQLVTEGFKRWIGKFVGETPALSSMCFSFSMAADTSLEPSESSDQGQWSFTIDLDNVPSRIMEPKFKEIEPKAPGLFQTAVEVFDEVMCHVGLTGTPQTVRYMAEYNVWFGTSTQEDYEEELGNQGYEPEDTEGMISPDDYDKSLPAWLLSPNATVLNKDALTELCQSTDSQVAELAHCVTALQACLKRTKGVISHPEDYEQVYPLVLLRWNKEDGIRRIYDDFIQRANECGDGYTTAICAENVGRDAKSFQKWRKRHEPVLTALQRANELIEMLSVEDND